jgi:hypothetical protein
LGACGVGSSREEIADGIRASRASGAFRPVEGVFLLGQSDAPYASLAREMNTSEGALKVAIQRLRKQYRDLFRQEIADTVANPAEVEPELQFLAGVLTRK